MIKSIINNGKECPEWAKFDDYPTVKPSGYIKPFGPLINNMRVNFQATPQTKALYLREKYKRNPEALATTETIVISGRKPKFQTIRRPVNGHVCIIDWLNITFDIATINEKYRRADGQDDDLYMAMCQQAASDLSITLGAIFGKEFRDINQNQNGANFYKYSFNFGNNYGKICIGGQRDSVLIMLNGTGCTLADKGWESRLHDFLKDKETHRPKITRIDLAHDDINGDYLDVHVLDELESDDLFSCGGPKHTVGHLGDWKYNDPRNKGLTLNLGMRESGKFTRFYEKGKKLGDKDGEYSNWVRAEVEFKASDRIIPTDVLLDPSSYFMGAYPVFADLFDYERINKLEIIQKTSEITLQHSFDWLHRQAGKYFSFYRSFMSDKEIIDIIQSDNPDDVPTRLHLPHAFCLQQALMGNTHHNFKPKELDQC